MIDRESLIEASLAAFVRQALLDRGYDQRKWEMIEAYPAGLAKLDRILIAVGFNFDDGGEQGECGSDLKHRNYTIEFWVFGRTHTQARNVANTIKFAIESGDYGTIPLLDISKTPPVEIDRLTVMRAHAAQQIFNDPEAWQQFVWTTTVVLEDWYSASAA